MEPRSEGHPARSGERVGRFLLLHPLRPPAHRTWMAFDLSTLEESVVRLAGRAGRAARFQLELQALRRLDLPGLPATLAGDGAGDPAWAAVSHVPGVPVAALLEAGGLDPEAAVGLLWEVARLLDGLHSRGLVHGAVRADNVLLGQDGAVHLVGIWPQGLRSRFDSGSDAGEARGDESPERLGGQPATPSGDLWSFGLLAFHVFSGRPLVPAGTVAEVKARIDSLSGALASERRLTRTMPDSLEPLVRGLLAPSAEARPGTEGGLAEALRSVVDPSGSALARVLQERLPEARAKEAERRSRSAGRKLLRGEYLAATSTLRAAARLDSPGSIWSRVARECLWRSFLAPATSEESLARAVACLQVLRGCLDHGVAELGTAARFRLRRVGEGIEELAALISELPPEEEVPEARAFLESRLLEDPEDDAALVALACLDPDLADRTGEDQLAGLPAEVRRKVELPDTRTPSGASGSGVRGVPSLFSQVDAGTSSVVTREHAEVLFFRATVLAKEGDLVEAASILARLARSRDRIGAKFLGPTLSLLLDELRTRLPREGAPHAPAAELSALLGLAEAIEQPLVATMVGRLLVSSAEAGGFDLDELAASHPVSLPVLEAAAARSRRRGETAALGRHATSLGWACLTAGMLEEAGTWIELAHATAPSSGTEAARARLGGARVVEANRAKAWEACERGIETAAETRDAVEVLDEFLADHPDHPEALATRLNLALLDQDPVTAGGLARRLAHRSLLRRAEGPAREHLRTTLRSDPMAQDALVCLGAMAPLPWDAPRDHRELDTWILELHHLDELAVVRLQSALRGDQADRDLLEAMVRLCRRLGTDPAPHLLAMARIELEAGYRDRARGLFQEAMSASPESRGSGTAQGLRTLLSTSSAPPGRSRDG